MTIARWVGIVLIVLGLVGFLSGGFSFTRDRKAVDLGPIEVDVKDREHVRISPLLAGLSLAGGVVLLAVGTRRRAV